MASPTTTPPASPATPTIDYSIVVPVYYNQLELRDSFAGLYEKVIQANPRLRGEIVYVDDGSGDGSLAVLLELQKANPTLVRVVKLTRNFGQVAAIHAGWRAARGRCVVTMSADGQDPPELINQMLGKHLDEGYQVVLCAREGRDESWFRVATSRFFYWLIRKTSFPHMPAGGFDYVLVGRRVLDVIFRNPDAHPFFQGQILWPGYKPVVIGYHRAARKTGKSRWTFAKKVTLLIDGVMAYSYLPIRLMALVGLCTALCGFAYAFVILINRLVTGSMIKGWAPMVIIMLVIGGLQMLMIGIIGEYLWRTLAQTRNRDQYIVDEVYE